MTGKIVCGAEASSIDPAAASKAATPGADWKLWVGQSVEELKTKPDATRKVYLHCPIEVPKSWKPTDKIELIVSTFSHGVGDVVGPVDAWLNGQQVVTQGKCAARGYGDLEDGTVVDVSKILKLDGPNALCVVAGQKGFMGEVTLRRKPTVAAEIEVKGEFTTQLDQDKGLGKTSLPGIANALYCWKDDVTVPSDWKGSRIFIDIDIAKLEEFDSFAINDKVVFHPVNWFKAVTWMDITPWVKLGAPNRLTLISKKGTREWQPGAVEVKSIKLQRVNP